MLDAGTVAQLLDDRHDLVPDDRDPGRMVDERVAQLTGGVEGVVLDDRGAQAQHREEGDDVLWTVGHQQGDAVAGADPEAAKSLGHPADLVTDLGPGRAGTDEIERPAVGPTRDRGVELVGQGGVAVVEMERHARPVRRGPHGRLDRHGSPFLTAASTVDSRTLPTYRRPPASRDGPPRGLARGTGPNGIGPAR